MSYNELKTALNRGNGIICSFFSVLEESKTLNKVPASCLQCYLLMCHQPALTSSVTKEEIIDSRLNIPIYL